jgi:hypothetical protein
VGSGINNTVLPVVKYKVDLIYSKLLLDDTILGVWSLRVPVQERRGKLGEAMKRTKGTKIIEGIVKLATIAHSIK